MNTEKANCFSEQFVHESIDTSDLCQLSSAQLLSRV